MVNSDNISFISFCTGPDHKVLNYTINCECCIVQPISYIQHTPSCLPAPPTSPWGACERHSTPSLDSSHWDSLTAMMSWLWDRDKAIISFCLSHVLPAFTYKHFRCAPACSVTSWCGVKAHTNTPSFRIQALIGYLFLSLSFPTIGRTEENATCISNPFSNLPKALKSLLITLGLLITTLLVDIWKLCIRLGSLLKISL